MLRCGPISLLACSALLASLLLIRSDAAAGTRSAVTERSISSGDVRGVKVRVQVGSLRVFADSPDALKIRAVRRVEGGSATEVRRWLNETQVLIEQRGKTLLVEDRVPEALKRGSRGKPNARLEVELHLPPGLDLDAAIGVGDTEAAGPFGDCAIDSGVGNIRLARLALRGASARVQSGVGDVTATLSVLPGRALKMDVGVGNVLLALPATARVQVSARTGVGDLRSELSLASPERGGNVVGRTLSGTLNGGGTEVAVRVGTGNIRLERQ